MKKAFISELVRFRKTARTTIIAMAGLAILATTLLFIGFDDGGRGGPDAGTEVAATDLSAVGGNVEAFSFAATLLGIAALAMFALSVARDYESGAIRMLLVGQPKRAIVLGGKLLALLAITIVGVAVATLGMVGLSYALSGTAAVDTALWSTAAGWSAVWSAFVNTALATAVWGVIGAALAMLTRSAATSITAGIAYLMVGENLLSLVWDSASEWLPGGILSAFSSGGTAAVTYSKSAWLMAGYAAVCAIAAFVVMQRRDITD